MCGITVNVDLFSVVADQSVSVNNLQVRVGNSTNAAENKLCAWIPDSLGKKMWSDL